MIVIKHPYGKTKFKEKIKGGYELAEAFPNYGFHKGHSQAKSFAEHSREQGLFAKVVPKVNASAVYVKKKGVVLKW